MFRYGTLSLLGLRGQDFHPLPLREFEKMRCGDEEKGTTNIENYE